MCDKRFWCLLVILGAVFWMASGASAQQVTTTTPFNSLNDNFFERMGVSFQGNWRGFHFSQGSANLAIPQFGGYDPSAGGRAGYSVRGDDFNADFAFQFGQGSRRSNVTQAPSTTMFNGQTSIFSDTSQSPFVISVVPVVGGFPYNNRQYVPSRIEQYRSSMSPGMTPQAFEPVPIADRDLAPMVGARPQPALPVAAPEEPNWQGHPGAVAQPPVARQDDLARADQPLPPAADQTEAMKYVARAREAEEAGKGNLARLYYQMAARRADGPLQKQLEQKAETLGEQ